MRWHWSLNARRFALVRRWKEVVGPVFVCMYVCPSVQAFSPLEPEQLIGSGRVNICSMHRNGGRTMVSVLDQSVAGTTCHVRSRKPLQRSSSQGCRPNQWTDSAQAWWADSYHWWTQSIGVSDCCTPFTRVVRT